MSSDHHLMPRKSIGEAIKEDRERTLNYRKYAAEVILDGASRADSHWLAFSLIDAARTIWGKEHDELFLAMSAAAAKRARGMRDAWGEQWRKEQDGISQREQSAPIGSLVVK